MPLYEYRCRECDTVFEQRRPMADADAPARCPSGHRSTRRLLSVFAAVGGAAPAAASPVPAGGCGSACACH